MLSLNINPIVTIYLAGMRCLSSKPTWIIEVKIFRCEYLLRFLFHRQYTISVMITDFFSWEPKQHFGQHFLKTIYPKYIKYTKVVTICHKKYRFFVGGFYCTLHKLPLHYLIFCTFGICQNISAQFSFWQLGYRQR